MQEGLSEEVLGKIIPFSGLPQEMSATEKMISSGMAIQKVQTAYTTAVAVQKSRSISRVTANVLEEAKLAGSSFYYGWTAKSKDGKTSKIEGPSIDLAMCMARNYGNCALDVEEDETLTHYRFRGSFIDLETGFTCPRLFRQRKSQNIGMKDTDRAEDITYQIGQSKAIRNCITRAMPSWLIDLAIDTAKASELNKIKPENIAIARAKSFEFFRHYGVSQERIEAKISRKLDDWTPQDIVELRGMATALKEGRVSDKELFPEVEEKEVAKEEKKGKGKQKEPAFTAVNEEPELAPHECPDREGATMTKEFCDSCKGREGCPAWNI